MYLLLYNSFCFSQVIFINFLFFRGTLYFYGEFAFLRSIWIFTKYLNFYGVFLFFTEHLHFYGVFVFLRTINFLLSPWIFTDHFYGVNFFQLRKKTSKRNSFSQICHESDLSSQTSHYHNTLEDCHREMMSYLAGNGTITVLTLVTLTFDLLPCMKGNK